MSYKLFKITLKKVSTYSKVDEIEPYTLQIEEEPIPPYLRYYVRGQRTTKLIYLEAYPELISDPEQTNTFKEYANDYFAARKVVYSVDSLHKEYLDFLLEHNCFPNREMLRLDWDRHIPSIETSSSLLEIIFKSNELQTDLPQRTSLTIKVGELILCQTADKTSIRSYLDDCGTAFKAQKRSKTLCGLSSLLSTNLSLCVVGIQIRTNANLPSWQKKLLLRDHDRLAFSITFYGYGEIARNDTHPKRQIGKIIFGSFLMNHKITVFPISFPMFSIAEIKHILARHDGVTKLRYSLVGLGGIAKDMRKLVKAAKLIKHLTEKVLYNVL